MQVAHLVCPSPEGVGLWASMGPWGCPRAGHFCGSHPAAGCLDIIFGRRVPSWRSSWSGMSSFVSSRSLWAFGGLPAIF